MSMQPTQPFDYRAPSASWEQVLLPNSSEHVVWVWYRPPQMPNGAIVRLPAELASYPARKQLTVRWLLSFTGIEPSNLAAWYLFGTPYQHGPGMDAALDLVVPEPPGGMQPEIAFVAHAPAQMVPQQLMTQQPAQVAAFDTSAPSAVGQTVAASPEIDKLLHRIASEWQSSITLERQLAALRKKVVGLLSKLNSMDKELSPEERLHADNNDIKDWQEARRWLKDVSNKAHRYVKEHDIGLTSMAGRRGAFAETYKTVIEPKRPVAGLDGILRDFDSYRKSLQTLLNHMNNAYTTASHEGERRAQRVLAKIRAKARGGAKSTVSRKRT